MIDLSSETMLPAEQARRWLGTRLGTTPSRVAFRRWFTSGIKGHVLETLMVGGRRFTSHEALQRFVSATSGEPAALPSARRRREAEAASREAERVFGGAGGGR